MNGIFFAYQTGKSGSEVVFLLPKIIGFQIVQAVLQVLFHHDPGALAIVLFLVLLCSMSGLPVLEKHLKDRSNHFEVHLELKNKLDLPGFVSTVRALGIRIDDIESNPAYLNSGLSVFTVSFTVSSAELKQYKKHGEIIEALRSLDYVYYIEEMN